MDSLLLSYIDIRSQGLFPPRLIIGETRDLGPQLIRVGSLVPVKDASADSVFQGRTIHIPVEEPRVEV